MMATPLSVLGRPLAGWRIRLGQSTQTSVWPELVVILAPGFDQMARFGEPTAIEEYSVMNRS